MIKKQLITVTNDKTGSSCQLRITGFSVYPVK